MLAPISRIKEGLKTLGRKVYIDLVVDLVGDDCLDEFDMVPRELPNDDRRCFLMNLLEHPRQAGSNQSLLTLTAVNARRIEATDFPRFGRDELAREFSNITFDRHNGVTPQMLFLYRLATEADHPDLDYLRRQYLMMNLRDSGPRSSAETPHRRARLPQREQ